MNTSVMFVRSLLQKLATHFKVLEGSGQRGQDVVRKGSAFGDATNDTEIRMDQKLGLLAQTHCVSCVDLDIGRVSVEGQPDRVLDTNGTYWVTVDPLDGSLNYKTARAGMSLPFSACVTILERGKDATFADIVGAGVIDLRSGEMWDVGVQHEDTATYRSEHGNTALRTLDATRLDLGSQIVIGEMYYPDNRDMLCKMFANEKGWLRNPGSAAYEMALVASGVAAAFICDRQKQHELGMGYALVKGSGGVAVDFNGKDLGPRIYDFKTQTPVILAANQDIANQILERYRTKV